MLRSITLLCATFLLTGFPLASQANNRLALVFGIDRYDHLPDLANAGNDARAVSEKLEALGFEVMLHEGATQREVYRALDRFESRLTDSGGTGMVFFAGHGIQADGRNYLIPSDAQVEVESDLEAEAINAGRILESMARADNPLNILVLDACRDNPLPRRTRSASRGLTVTNIPSGAKGTAILYAAGEGQAAQDGAPGGHGIFTESLLKALDIPNLKLEEVIKQTTRGVLERTGGHQRPWSLASIQGDFVFNPKAVVLDLPAVAPSVDRQLEEVLKQKDAELEAQQQRLQAEAEARLQEERARMEAEFAQTAEKLEEAKRMKEEAEAARIAAESQLAMLRKPEQPARPPSNMQAVEEPVKVIVQSRSYGPHEMVYLKADCFLMGSEVGRIGRHSDESAHQVCLNAFLIDRYEVTFEAYDEFARSTGRDLPDDDGMGRGRRPVINVDWDDARAYARWAGEKYGIQFRLPTEAEWEYACRSGGQDEEYCGSNDPKEVAVFWRDQTSPVGSKKPNKLGLHDMSGNAWEMTCSSYKSGSSFSTAYGDYTGEETTCVEKNPGTGKTLIFRGGSWESDVDEIRARTRRFNAQYTGGGGYSPPWINELGFRLVADPN